MIGAWDFDVAVEDAAGAVSTIGIRIHASVASCELDARREAEKAVREHLPGMRVVDEPECVAEYSVGMLEAGVV